MKEKIKNLSRNEKENLYIEKMTELQKQWGNPIDSDWNFVQKMTDEKLEKEIEETIGQINFEKGLSLIVNIFKTIIAIFVSLGIIGLLVFGIRQLFNF